MKLTNAEVAEITEILEAGGVLPDKWRQRSQDFKRGLDAHNGPHVIVMEN
jgi:hypothetical protein